MSREFLLSRRQFIKLSLATTGSLFFPDLLNRLLTPVAKAAPGSENFAISVPGEMEGHFFTETRGEAPYPQGYAVVDDKQAPFWTIINKFGGIGYWGPPVSNRFREQGAGNRICQAFQKGIFQLTTDNDGFVKNIEWLNIFDQLSALGQDRVLSSRQVPSSFDWSSDQGKSWNAIMQNHLAILDQNQAIKTAYLSDPLALLKHGLPMGIEDYGNQVSIRCQRSVIQQWKETVSWAKAGAVTVALGGDIAKEFSGIIPEQAGKPVDPPINAIVKDPIDITRGNQQRKNMAITFDCGAGSKPTPQIIYTLEKNQIKASFFITGKWAEENPGLVKNIASNENPIGNHTYSHPHLKEYSDLGIAKELEQTEDIILQLTGQSTKPWWRSPFGEYDQRILSAAARAGWINHVLWTGEMSKQGWISGDSGDWVETNTPAQIQANVMRALSYLGNGTITVHHCGSDQEITALDPTIKSIKAAGYGILTVQELMR